MTVSNIFALLGGVALFLFGMSLMGDGLKKVAGSKLEVVLYKLTSTPIKGILFGTGVTAVIQSSSATSVMVVGFVNSGMMKIRQAIGIIMGAIIGTSITGWIICLSSFSGSGFFEILSTDTFTAFLAVVGIILLLFTERESNHHTATVFLGFSVLMFGIKAMTEAVYPLRESEAFIRLLTTFSNPFIGVLIGIIFTSIIQSASAAVGILQALSVTGAISFNLALPIIMGIAIGASVPVLLSALGANVNGKRTALIYLMVDTLGAILFSILFYGANAIVFFDFMSMPMNMMNIALLNTVFRAVIVFLLTPFIGVLEKLVSRMIKDNTETAAELRDVDRLEERFLEHPALSISQTRIVINSMACLAQSNLEQAFTLLGSFSDSGFAKAYELENIIDTYEDKLGSYIVKIMRQELKEDQNRTLSMFLHCINDYERIGDHAKNLAEAAQEIAEKKISFSSDAEQELQTLVCVMRETIQTTVKAFTEDDMEAVYRIAPLEEIIDNLCDEYKMRHIERIQKGLCQYEHGFVFNDILTDAERIGDHCSNIGVAIRMDHNELSGKHGIISKQEIENGHDFDRYYQEYLSRFNIT